jgi:hypothetical protein
MGTMASLCSVPELRVDFFGEDQEGHTDKGEGESIAVGADMGDDGSGLALVEKRPSIPVYKAH